MGKWVVRQHAATLSPHHHASRPKVSQGRMHRHHDLAEKSSIFLPDAIAARSQRG
jgi:hypothetical protein